MAVDPLTLGVLGGTAVAGGATNYFAGEANRKANASELRRIAQIVDAIKDPTFDMSYITPEDFQLVATYKPEIAAYIGQKAPELIKGLSPEAQQGLDAQMQALSKFRNLSTTGEDLQSRILKDQALRQSQIQNQGQQGAIMDRFNRMGQGGSSSQLIASLLSQQGSNLAGQRSAEQSAMDAYNTRLQASRDAASLGGDIRNSALSMEGKNANTINDFNNRLVDSQRRWESDRANTVNDAQLKNIASKQKIADANTALHNTSRQLQQDKVNSNAQQVFTNDINKAGLKTGVGMQNIAQNNQNYSNSANLINSLVSGVNKGVATYGAYGQGQGNPKVKNSYDLDDPYNPYKGIDEN